MTNFHVSPVRSPFFVHWPARLKPGAVSDRIAAHLDVMPTLLDAAATQPEVLQRLRDAYTAWFADVSTTRPDNFGPSRIVIGSDHETTTVLTRQNWRVPDQGDSGREGTWLLRAERAADYALELRWLKPIAPGTIEVSAGAVVRTIDVHEATDRISIEGLRIPKGDLAFTATHRQGQARAGAYHAILIRQ